MMAILVTDQASSGHTNTASFMAPMGKLPVMLVILVTGQASGGYTNSPSMLAILVGGQASSGHTNPPGMMAPYASKSLRWPSWLLARPEVATQIHQL
jgi:hypothetical protein